MLSSLLLISGLLTAQSLAIIPDQKPELANASQGPSEWKAIEDWAIEMKEPEIFDQESIENIQDKVDQLKHHDATEWFKQNSLKPPIICPR